MSQHSELGELIAHYLLGELSGEEQQNFEERYFMDDQLFASLLLVEAELIDRYARNDLNEGDRERFEKYFLRSDERKQRVALAIASIKSRGDTLGGSKKTETSIGDLTWRQRLLGWLRRNTT